MRTWQKAAVSVAIAAGLAACGGTTTVAARAPATTTSTTAPAMTRAQAAAAYETDVAPANDALGTFRAKVQTWTDTTSVSQAEADAAPFISACQTAEARLATLAQEYPPAATDLRVQVSNLGAMLGDLAALSGGVTQQWAQGVATDAGRMQASTKIVHADLGIA